MNKSSGGALSKSNISRNHALEICSDFSITGNDTPRSHTIGLQRISEALIVSFKFDP